MSEQALISEVPPYLAVVGPTASGKSALAMQLAKHYGGEIVNADSVQLYRGFDVGSAKATRAERAEIPHHLIDVFSWHDACDAAWFAREAQAVIRAIGARGRLPIVVGGSGLYLRCLWGERFHALPSDPSVRAVLAEWSAPSLYAELSARDPERAREIHLHDKVRLVRALEIARLSGQTMRELTPSSSPSFRPRCTILMAPPRPRLHELINARARAMLAAGLVDEVSALLAQGCPYSARPMQSIGYKQVLCFLKEEIGLADLPERIAAATRQYAKRQVTWFRRCQADLQLAEARLDDELRVRLEACLAADEG